MTVRLRPHHLLCLLTYVGKGYSPAFTANYDVIAGRLGAGEDILIVNGADDVCAPLLAGDAPHCLSESVVERDRLAARDVGELLARPIIPGQRFSLGASILDRLRVSFATGAVRQACEGCEWSGLCTVVAADGFAGVRLRRS